MNILLSFVFAILYVGIVIGLIRWMGTWEIDLSSEQIKYDALFQVTSERN